MNEYKIVWKLAVYDPDVKVHIEKVWADSRNEAARIIRGNNPATIDILRVNEAK